jgi:hypothetical protein
MPPSARSLALPSPSSNAVARSLLLNALTGLVVGWGVLGALLLADVAGLGTLLAGSREAPLLLAALAMQFGVGFAVFAAATGLFLLPRGGAARR